MLSYYTFAKSLNILYHNIIYHSLTGFPETPLTESTSKKQDMIRGEVKVSLHKTKSR